MRTIARSTSSMAAVVVLVVGLAGCSAKESASGGEEACTLKGTSIVPPLGGANPTATCSPPGVTVPVTSSGTRYQCDVTAGSNRTVTLSDGRSKTCNCNGPTAPCNFP